MILEVRKVYGWTYDPAVDAFALSFSVFAENQAELESTVIPGSAQSMMEQFSQFRGRYNENGDTFFFLLMSEVEPLEEPEIDEIADAVVSSFNASGIKLLYDGTRLWLWLSSPDTLDF